MAYPDRAYKIFIINSEFLLSATWKIVSPLLDKRTLQKIQVIKEKELLKYIDKD